MEIPIVQKEIVELIVYLQNTQPITITCEFNVKSSAQLEQFVKSASIDSIQLNVMYFDDWRNDL